MTLDELIPLMPPFQAAANTVSTVLLSAGYYFIRSGNRGMHRNCMALTYHNLVGYAPFAGQGWIRPIYFTLLGSHIVLAAVIVPLVLLTVWFAATGNFTRHPGIARWTLPIWLFVSVSGVVIYILGFHIYKPEI
jgi:uncharacterized membrane protein YozB (DUF420 family)